MTRFTRDVTVVNRLTERVHSWELCQVVSYKLVDTDGSQVVNIPPGFVTDFASVPRPFWFWISPWGRHGRAAIVHDYLYQFGSIFDPTTGDLVRPDRPDADRIFREAMHVLDDVILTNSKFWKRFPGWVLRVRRAFAVPRRWVMWLAVRLFGFKAYKKLQAEAAARPLEHAMLEHVERMVTRGDAPPVATQSG